MSEKKIRSYKKGDTVHQSDLSDTGDLDTEKQINKTMNELSTIPNTDLEIFFRSKDEHVSVTGLSHKKGRSMSMKDEQLKEAQQDAEQVLEGGRAIHESGDDSIVAGIVLPDEEETFINLPTGSNSGEIPEDEQAISELRSPVGELEEPPELTNDAPISKHSLQIVSDYFVVIAEIQPEPQEEMKEQVEMKTEIPPSDLITPRGDPGPILVMTRTESIEFIPKEHPQEFKTPPIKKRLHREPIQKLDTNEIFDGLHGALNKLRETVENSNKNNSFFREKAIDFDSILESKHNRLLKKKNRKQLGSICYPNQLQEEADEKRRQETSKSKKPKKRRRSITKPKKLKKKVSVVVSPPSKRIKSTKTVVTSQKSSILDADKKKRTKGKKSQKVFINQSQADTTGEKSDTTLRSFKKTLSYKDEMKSTKTPKQGFIEQKEPSTSKSTICAGTSTKTNQIRSPKSSKSDMFTKHKITGKQSTRVVVNSFNSKEPQNKERSRSRRAKNVKKPNMRLKSKIVMDLDRETYGKIKKRKSPYYLSLSKSPKIINRDKSVGSHRKSETASGHLLDNRQLTDHLKSPFQSQVSKQDKNDLNKSGIKTGEDVKRRASCKGPKEPSKEIKSANRRRARVTSPKAVSGLKPFKVPARRSRSRSLSGNQPTTTSDIALLKTPIEVGGFGAKDGSSFKKKREPGVNQLNKLFDKPRKDLNIKQGNKQKGGEEINMSEYRIPSEFSVPNSKQKKLKSTRKKKSKGFIKFKPFGAELKIDQTKDKEGEPKPAEDRVLSARVHQNSSDSIKSDPKRVLDRIIAKRGSIGFGESIPLKNTESKLKRIRKAGPGTARVDQDQEMEIYPDSSSEGQEKAKNQEEGYFMVSKPPRSSEEVYELIDLYNKGRTPPKNSDISSGPDSTLEEIRESKQPMQLPKKDKEDKANKKSQEPQENPKMSKESHRERVILRLNERKSSFSKVKLEATAANSSALTTKDYIKIESDFSQKETPLIKVSAHPEHQNTNPGKRKGNKTIVQRNRTMKMPSEPATVSKNQSSRQFEFGDQSSQRRIKRTMSKGKNHKIKKLDQLFQKRQSKNLRKSQKYKSNMTPSGVLRRSQNLSNSNWRRGSSKSIKSFLGKKVNLSRKIKDSVDRLSRPRGDSHSSKDSNSSLLNRRKIVFNPKTQLRRQGVKKENGPSESREGSQGKNKYYSSVTNLNKIYNIVNKYTELPDKLFTDQETSSFVFRNIQDSILKRRASGGDIIQSKIFGRKERQERAVDQSQLDVESIRVVPSTKNENKDLSSFSGSDNNMNNFSKRMNYQNIKLGKEARLNNQSIKLKSFKKSIVKGKRKRSGKVGKKERKNIRFRPSVDQGSALTDRSINEARSQRAIKPRQADTDPNLEPPSETDFLVSRTISDKLSPTSKSKISMKGERTAPLDETERKFEESPYFGRGVVAKLSRNNMQDTPIVYMNRSHINTVNVYNINSGADSRIEQHSLTNIRDLASELTKSQPLKSPVEKEVPPMTDAMISIEDQHSQPIKHEPLEKKAKETKPGRDRPRGKIKKLYFNRNLGLKASTGEKNSWKQKVFKHDNGPSSQAKNKSSRKRRTKRERKMDSSKKDMEASKSNVDSGQMRGSQYSMRSSNVVGEEDPDNPLNLYYKLQNSNRSVAAGNHNSKRRKSREGVLVMRRMRTQKSQDDQISNDIESRFEAESEVDKMNEVHEEIVTERNKMMGQINKQFIEDLRRYRLQD